MLNFILRWRELALLVLVVLYGICLTLLQDLAPGVAMVLFLATLGVVGLALVVKAWINRKRLSAALWRLCLLPLNFYKTGRASSSASEVTTISVVVSAALCVGIAVVLLLFTVIPLFALIIALPLAGMAFFAWKSNLDLFLLPRRFLMHLKNAPSLSSATLPRIRWWLLPLEIGVIVITVILTTRPFYDSPPNWQLSGNEVEWLTSTVAAAHTGLLETGRIPRWQPYLTQGEPIIENPFNFIFNPFASAPSLVLGPVAGLRISVIVGYFLAGFGGWFLGRMLGFGALARVLLALLLIGKGNLHAMMNSGYYQLALSQIYMPYVIGGVLALFRWPARRWPVVLTALALALQFLSGNIWYVLPTAFGAVCVACVLLVGAGKRWIDFVALKRLLLAAIFAVGISSVVALPVVLQFKQLGRHPDEVDGGWFVPLPEIVHLYFDPNPNQLIIFREPSYENRESYRLLKDLDEFYFTYIIPPWFVVLILVALPLYRPISGRERRIWWVALILLGLATLWGAGGKQPILWLYQNIPALAQWRFVGRALAVGSFWLAVLVTMRVDDLWRHVGAADWSVLLQLRPRLAKLTPIILSGVVLAASAYAAADVNDQWYKIDHIVKESDPVADRCITWLRTQHPGEPLAVWQQQYADITTYLNNRVRTWSVGADFDMLPEKPTIGSPLLDLNAVKPQYARLNYAAEVPWTQRNDYHVLLDSPKSSETAHCLYEREDILPYAYTVTQAAIEDMNQPKDLPVVELKAFSPVHLFERRGDQVALIVTDKRTESTIVGVQEKAYPGWRVEVDGQPAQLESVGGQIGVILPAGDDPVQVYFVYDPVQPVIGGLITLMTAALCTVYLLIRRRHKTL